jgi:uncharacterized protein
MGCLEGKENQRKHDISFEEAKTVFSDPFSVTVADPKRSEDRFVDVGCSTQGKLLVVVYAERQSKIRIISCRRATAQERKVYERSKS